MDRERRKKEEERKILSFVYKKEIVENFSSPSETPDFIIIDSSNNLKIGIEIAKIFPNQETAIHFNNSNFFNELINDYSNPKKKKKKIEKFSKNLSLMEVIGDAITPGPTILWRKSLIEFFDFFENIISIKSLSYQVKREDLVAISLVTYDITSYLESISIKIGQLYGVLRQHSIFNKILNSSFLEIIMVSQFKDGLYHFSLKRLIFLSEFAIFQNHWNNMELEKNMKDNLLTKLNNLLICLLFLGFKNIYLTTDEKHRYIIFGTTYWKIEKETGDLKEVDYLALDFNNYIKAEDQLKNWKKYPKVYEKYLEFRKEFIPVLDSGYFHKKD